MLNKIFLLITLYCLNTVDAQNLDLFEKEIFIKGKDTLKYRILTPINYNQKNIYPVHLFLHGAGERGNDNELQLIHGAKLFLKKENREKYSSNLSDILTINSTCRRITVNFPAII